MHLLRRLRLYSVPVYAFFALTFMMIATAPGQTLPRIPPELLSDDHVREEFGVNQFTTPSIKKLFEVLDDLGSLPYEEVKRSIPENVPTERTLLALTLGRLIADGFLVVQVQKFGDFEDVGRAVVKYAKVLGADTNVTRHVKSALELGTGGEWQKLKEELAKTQADVEVEMVQLRDVDVAHLIALGGWLRAFEVAVVTCLTPYSEEKSSALRRIEIAEYFLQELDTLAPQDKERPHIKELDRGLKELLALIKDGPESKGFTKDELTSMRQIIAGLVNTVTPAPPAAPTTAG